MCNIIDFMITVRKMYVPYVNLPSSMSVPIEHVIEHNHKLVHY